MESLPKRITVHPLQCGGRPCVRGMRIRVSDVLDLLAAGLSAHESKSWLVARSAVPADCAMHCTLRHYQAIPEYIAGFGLMFLKQPNPSQAA